MRRIDQSPLAIYGLTVSATGLDSGQDQVGIEVLRADGFSAVINTSTPSPTVMYWGDDVGPDLTGLLEISEVAISHGTLDVVAPTSITPEHGSGYPGRPGLEGFRTSGSGWAPRFTARTENI